MRATVKEMRRELSRWWGVREARVLAFPSLIFLRPSCIEYRLVAIYFIFLFRFFTLFSSDCILVTSQHPIYIVYLIYFLLSNIKLFLNMIILKIFKNIYTIYISLFLLYLIQSIVLFDKKLFLSFRSAIVFITKIFFLAHGHDFQ